MCGERFRSRINTEPRPLVPSKKGRTMKMENYFQHTNRMPGAGGLLFPLGRHHQPIKDTIMIKLKHSQNPAARAPRGRFLALITLAALLVTSAAAQTFTTLHAFSGGSDGARPVGGLILS